MIGRRDCLKYCLAYFLVATASSTALAAEATLMQAELTLDEPAQKPGLFLSASFEFDLPHTLYEALHRGIPLYFVHEFRVTKDRWYWIDKDIVDEKYIVRLAFNPITQRYRLSYSGFSQDYDTLEQVIPYLKTVRRWRVAKADILSSPNYTAEVRFYLDTTKLPKAMQVTNANLGDWTISSDWESLRLPAELLPGIK